jgi:dihydroorotase
MRTLLRNGRILDPSQELDVVGSVLIEDDQVIEIGEISDLSDIDEVYD